MNKAIAMIKIVVILIFLTIYGPLLMAGENDTTSMTVVKVSRTALFLDSENAKWVSYGVALGAAGLLSALLLWNSHRFKTSIWMSHFLFAVSAAALLSFVLFAENLKSLTDLPGTYFGALIRFQLVLSAVMIFSLLKSSENKQMIGTLFSALVGAVLGASMLDFIWPIEAFVLASEIVLIGASLAIGARQYYLGSSKTLFFHLIVMLAMSYVALWLPDLKKISSEAFVYPLFAAVELFMLIAVASSLWCSVEEYNTDKIGRLKRDIYNAELRLHKQAQMVQLLQADCQRLEARLQEETKVHYQVEMQDNLKIKALEEMSQDIAQGMMAYLKEMDYGSHQIMNECKTPKARLHRIRAYAERSSLLANKVKDVMGFLQRTQDGDESQKVNASDLLQECLRICHDKIVRNGVELEIESYEKDLWLEGRLTLLAQGFLGLLYNALEAIESSDVRRVTIKLQRVQIEGAIWVQLAVSNSGSGIPTGIKSKVFHSKKRDGLGTHSLGLSMAFGVFESFGGNLTLDNEAVATTFVALLPLYRKGEDSSLRLAI